MSDIWTIQKTLNWSKEYLERAGISQARLHAELLMSYATGLTRLELYTQFDLPLSADQREKMREALKAHAAGKPLQYIQGTAPFRHLDIIVDERVLIPRPETEILVEYVLKEIDATSFNHNDIVVIDVCTGSGCIAASIAAERVGVHVLARDISQDALCVARKNIEHLQLQDYIAVEQGDLLSDCVFESADIIVSNPPYIPHEVVEGLDTSVKDFEPMLALDGGPDGLKVFRDLAQQAREVLKPGGAFVCELHETMLDEACTYAQNLGFVNCEIHRDLNEKPRILVAHKG